MPTRTRQSVPGLLVAVLSLFICGSSAAQTITVGTISGARGASVWFDVTLNPQWKSIAGTQNEISFNAVNTPVVTCLVEPGHGKSLSYARLPTGCGTGTCSKVRALILSTSDATALPSSVLYRCRIDIPSNATPGAYALTVQNPSGSDTDGNIKAVSGISGQITVF